MTKQDIKYIAEFFIQPLFLPLNFFYFLFLIVKLFINKDKKTKKRLRLVKKHLQLQLFCLLFIVTFVSIPYLIFYKLITY